MNKILITLNLLFITCFTHAQEYRVLKIIQKQTKEISAVATCDQYFATVNDDKSLFVWDYSGKKILKYNVGVGEINTLTFSPDSKSVWVGVTEVNSKGFERPVLKCLSVVGKDVKEFVDSTLVQEQVDLFYHENTTGVQNAIVQSSNAFPQLNIKTGIKVPQVSDGLSHIELIQSIAVSPNQERVASIDYFKILKIWDSVGNVLKSFQISNNKKNTDVFFITDTTLYVTPDFILNINSGTTTSLGMYEPYMGVPLNGKIYYYFDYNKVSESEKLIDIRTNSSKDIDLKNMYSLRVVASNDRFALLGVDGLIRILNINGDLLSVFGNDRAGEVITFREKKIVLYSKISTIGLAPNGEFLISGDEEGKIIIWRAEQ